MISGGRVQTLGSGEILSETVLLVALGSEKQKLVRGIKVTYFLSKVTSESLTVPRIEIGTGAGFRPFLNITQIFVRQ